MKRSSIDKNSIEEKKIIFQKRGFTFQICKSCSGIMYFNDLTNLKNCSSIFDFHCFAKDSKLFLADSLILKNEKDLKYLGVVIIF